MVVLSGKKSRIELEEGHTYFFASGKPLVFNRKERGKFVVTIDGEQQRWTENTIWKTPLFYEYNNKIISTKCIL